MNAFKVFWGDEIACHVFSIYFSPPPPTSASLHRNPSVLGFYMIIRTVGCSRFLNLEQDFNTFFLIHLCV